MRQFRAALATAGLLLSMLSGTAAQQAQSLRPPVTASLGTITGRVEIEANQQRTPVRWAKLTLIANVGGKTWTTTSDRNGRYRFDEIAAGDYRLRAEKPGFVGAPIEIHAERTLTTDLEMRRGGALEGRFIDDRGDGIARLTVTADRLSDNPDREKVTESYAALTDDLGRFRVHTLPPGRYRVHALPPPPASGERFFYPGTTNPDEATVIAIDTGETRDGLEFTVPTAPLSPIAAETIAAAEREASLAPEVPGFTARIAGRVTRSDTGQPIANAAVQIASQPGTVPSTLRLARTDGDGRFDVRRLAAGEYLVTATASGFINADGSLARPEGAGTRAAIKDGERYDRANVVLRRTTSIESRIFDEFGDPAPGVVVQVAEAVSALGLSRFRPDSAGAFRTTGATDDRGWFRVSGLFPGDYYLIAIPEPFERSSAGFGITYFPGVASADAARSVHMVAGMDALNATFGLVAARTVTVSGIAVDADGRPTPDLRLMLLPTDNAEIRVMVSASTSAAPDGTFSFRGVPEGSYVIQGFGMNMFGSAHITVAATANEEPRPVALTLRASTTVRGRVTFVGGAVPPAPGGVAIVFQPTDLASGPAGGGPGASRLSADWTFEISGFAQRGVLRVNTPPGWAPARILSEGRDITNAPYDFPTADVAGLEVVLTNRVGNVSGTVVVASQPVPDATVVVFGADSDGWPQLVQSLRVARTNAQGVFSLIGLLPGRYLAAAVPGLNAALDPARIAALRPLATPVLVTEGATTSVQLTIVK